MHEVVPKQNKNKRVSVAKSLEQKTAEFMGNKAKEAFAKHIGASEHATSNHR